jgi:L-aspartate oxidase
VTDSDEEVVIQQCWREIRQFMWNFVGIVRTTKRLERAQHRIDLLRQEIEGYYSAFRLTPDLVELRNLVEVADLIVRSALSRHESRGLHYTLDYPETLAEAVDTVLVP